jgi:hypothetical protein
MSSSCRMQRRSLRACFTARATAVPTGDGGRSSTRTRVSRRGRSNLPPLGAGSDAAEFQQFDAFNIKSNFLLIDAAQPLQRDRWRSQGRVGAASLNQLRAGAMVETDRRVAARLAALKTYQNSCDWPHCGCSYYERQSNCASPPKEEEIHGSYANRLTQEGQLRGDFDSQLESRTHVLPIVIERPTSSSSRSKA